MKITTVGLKMVMCFVLIFIACHVTQDNKFWDVISSYGNEFVKHQNGMSFCRVILKNSRSFS